MNGEEPVLGFVGSKEIAETQACVEVASDFLAVEPAC